MKKFLCSLAALLLFPFVALNADDTVSYRQPAVSQETDPIVGAVNGIVKADGAGNISAAVADTDYLTPGTAASTYALRGANADITSMTALTSITRATGGAFNISIGSAAGDDFTIDTDKLVVEGDNGNVGIGTTSPTAKLHLPAGTTTASTAPLKFTSGALNTIAEAGAVEFLADAFYGTITTGAARKTFAFLESPTFTGTVTIPTPFTIGGVSVTATGTELNYVSGVTSAIQTQLNAKQATISFGTGVETALGVNVGSAGAFVVLNGTLGTPSSGSAANLTNFPTLNQDTTGKSAKTDALNSATTIVNVSAATAPTSGQVLTATSGTAATWQTPDTGFNNPMTTLGDIIYENAVPAADRLAGNTTSTKKFLTQTGNGTISAAPTWGTIAAEDVPTLNQNTTGTAANLSGTPALPNGTTATTQAASDNSTKLATTAYADAKVADAINDGTTAVAPSQNAVYDGLAGKVANDGTVNPANLLSNGNFENWSLGTATAPDGWTLAGASAAVAREGTTIKIGSYSAKVTRSGADCQIYQTVHTEKGITYFKGRKVTLSCWVYATVASRVRISIDDGVSSTYSSYHSGNSSWELLFVTKTIDASSATKVQVNLGVDTGDTSGYFDGVMIVEGESLFAFSLAPKEKSGIYCHAYLGSGQLNLTDNTQTKILLDTVTVDSLRNFDTTNHRFVASVAGYYLVQGNFYLQQVVANGRYVCAIEKNGAELAFSSLHSSNTKDLGDSVTTVVFLAVNDYVELAVSPFVGASTTDLLGLDPHNSITVTKID